MPQVDAVYTVKNWTRKKWDDAATAEIPGAKLFRLEVNLIYSGGIEGESSTQLLVTQNEDGTGSFVGMEKVIGNVSGKSGSFVLQHSGTFDNGKIKATLNVTPGSGTDELNGLSGQINLNIAEHGEHYPISFQYEV